MNSGFEIAGGMIKKYYGTETALVIPDGVTGIGFEAFEECENLRSVIIPDTVTKIGGKAFFGCTGLTSISIPDHVKKIGTNAFGCCSSLTSISLPDGMTEIGVLLFGGCDNLNSVTIPDRVERIGAYAFNNCTKLSLISLPKSVAEIGVSAFYGCENLTSIMIPDKVTRIEKNTFSGCKSLASIVIPNSVTEIGEDAFDRCSSLTSIMIPDSVTKIGERAFYDCSSLTSIIIPGSVTEIGEWAFDRCPNLTVICGEGLSTHKYCLENNVPFMFDYQYEAFHGLLPPGIEKLASPFPADEEKPYVFISYSHKDRERILRIITTLYESGWKIWYDEGLTIGDRYDETLERHVRNCAAFLLFITEHSPESKYIIENEIPWAIRYGKPIIKCILDEGNDHEISDGSVIATVSRSEIEPALEKVGELTKGERREAQGISVIVNPDARETASGKGFAYCLYSKESTSLPQTILLEAKYSGCVFYDAVRDGEDARKLKESACVIVFLDKAFLEDEHLMEILIREYQAGRNLAVCKTGEFKDSELPEELISLRKMQWLNFVHGITTDMNTKLAQHLQKSGCRNTAILPGFEYEETDRGIVITGYTGTNPNPRINIAADEIAEGAFDGCNRLQSFEIPDGVRKIGDGAFKNCTSLTSVTIPDGVEQIGKEVFYGCENLTSITIPDSVTKIGVRVFCRCTNLASAVLSGSLKELEQEAFSRCSSLTSIIIPDGVTEIGRAAFRNCESLASVTIPNSAARIGLGAFSDCKSLASIIIPDSVIEIGSFAFYKCDGLTSVNIPDGVTKIGEAAFEGCTRITAICTPGSRSWKYCEDNGIPAKVKDSPSPRRLGFFRRIFEKK